jgi:hypothetical protein
MQTASSPLEGSYFIPAVRGKTVGIKTIIFDLGRVLIDFDHRIAAKRIARFTDKDEDEILSLFFDSEITMSFEEGRLSPTQFFLKVKEILNLKLDYEDYIPIWQEIFFFSEKNRSEEHTFELQSP